MSSGRSCAVQRQERGLVLLGEGGDQPVVAVQDDVSVQAADPPQQNRRKGPGTRLFPVRSDPAVVGTGERAQRDHPDGVSAEPVDVPARMVALQHDVPAVPAGCQAGRVRPDGPAAPVHRAVGGEFPCEVVGPVGCGRIGEPFEPADQVGTQRADG
ncbi:hypothetical protein Ppa06_37600 [Planomonospora parontospora subsp. parontospora]|uniref:Uncharacterized protein n=2 Tax=Planomonospora parontospora TaxID=58119 RepID=A0AA37F624_9ACTN|nr:hypothetical protein GCM10010126_41300 [Planomonospora parontospora]GII09962.1 hypothetical protein Ppa06_37600 [Planomonospora parontospora subsp. parontospora]